MLPGDQAEGKAKQGTEAIPSSKDGKNKYWSMKPGSMLNLLTQLLTPSPNQLDQVCEDTEVLMTPSADCLGPWVRDKKKTQKR